MGQEGSYFSLCFRRGDFSVSRLSNRTALRLVFARGLGRGEEEGRVGKGRGVLGRDGMGRVGEGEERVRKGRGGLGKEGLERGAEAWGVEGSQESGTEEEARR